MKQFIAICSRNLKIYLRDKGSLVFSFLSMLIIIGLMLLFLGDTTVNDIMEDIKQIPGRGSEDDHTMVKNIIYLWTVAGILAINAATVTLAFYSNMIKDRTGNRLNSIMVMPIKRGTIVAGYIMSSWITSVIMCLITLFLSEIIGVAKGIDCFSFAVHMKLVGLIMINSFVYSAFMYFFASIIKTEGAWSGFGIVVGTLVGFLGGIYFPVGALSDSVSKIVKAFPTIYGTAMFRKVMMDSLETEFFDGMPETVREIFDNSMGINLTIGENVLSMANEIVILIVVGIVFALLSAIYLKFSKKADR